MLIFVIVKLSRLTTASQTLFFCTQSLNTVICKHMPFDKQTITPNKRIHIHLITSRCLQWRSTGTGEHAIAASLALYPRLQLCPYCCCSGLSVTSSPPSPPSPLLYLPFALGRSSLRSCGGTARSLLLGNGCLKVFPVEF